MACRFLEGRGRRDDIYSALKQVMPKGETIEVPAPLTKLAAIRPLKLFVSTTFDPLLVRALDRVHGDGASQVLAYSPGRRADLPRGWAPSGPPTVFHLLGRVDTDPSYAVTEEDLLKFFHSLQSEARRPERPLDQLDGAHLLLLGCRFDGWLARFFLRLALRKRLWLASGTDYLADRQAFAGQAPPTLSSTSPTAVAR